MITLGLDTEFALTNQDGKYITGIGMAGGTKADPFDLHRFHKYIGKDDIEMKRYEGFLIQEDNVFLELNTPVADDANSFKQIFTDQYFFAKYIADLLSAKNKEIFTHPMFGSFALFDKNQLNNDQARTFGCDPDFNAWTGAMNESPERETQIRTMGAHLHIGYPNHNIDKSREIVKILDMTLGVLSIKHNLQQLRSMLYGRMGAFRPKPYGVEYRFMPSNFVPLLIFNSLPNHYATLINSTNSFDMHQRSFTVLQLYTFIENIIKYVLEGGTVEKLFSKEYIDLATIAISINDVHLSSTLLNSTSFRLSLQKHLNISNFS